MKIATLLLILACSGFAQAPLPSPVNVSSGTGGTCAGLAGDITGTCAATTINASGVAIPNASTATTQATGDPTTKISTDAFVANALQAINPATNVQVSTTTVLPNTPTYSNGTAGVGATLTAGSNTTLAAIDGYSVQLTDRILVQNQVTVANNGCYTLTQAGSGSLPWILTRCVDYNTPTNINYTGSICTIQTGSMYAADTCFSLVALITTVGTSSITYSQQTAGANAGKPGGGVQFTGSTTSGDVVIVAPGASGKNIKDSGTLFTAVALLASPTFTGTPAAPTPAANDNTTKIATTAYVDRPVTFATPGTTHTFAGKADIFVCTSTCTITVPLPSAGVQYCVMNDDNVATVITLSAIGSSGRYENQARTAYGTATTGTLVSGGAVKDFVCLLGRDATHYLFASGGGTWTAN